MCTYINIHIYIYHGFKRLNLCMTRDFRDLFVAKVFSSTENIKFDFMRCESREEYFLTSSAVGRPKLNEQMYFRLATDYIILRECKPARRFVYWSQIGAVGDCVISAQRKSWGKRKKERKEFKERKDRRDLIGFQHSCTRSQDLFISVGGRCWGGFS